MNFNFNPAKTEVLNGALTDFIGDILPDFGFPDKRMNTILKETWPEDNWDRGKVYDMYKWYDQAVTNGNQRPWDADKTMFDNRDVVNYIKDNSSYIDTHVNHWAAVFHRGIQENWIDPVYVQLGLSPEHEAVIIADTLESGFDIIPRLPKQATYLALALGGLIVAWYGMPIIAKTFKVTSKKRRPRYAV